MVVGICAGCFKHPRILQEYEKKMICWECFEKILLAKGIKK